MSVHYVQATAITVARMNSYVTAMKLHPIKETMLLKQTHAFLSDLHKTVSFLCIFYHGLDWPNKPCWNRHDGLQTK